MYPSLCIELFPTKLLIVSTYIHIISSTQPLHSSITTMLSSHKDSTSVVKHTTLSPNVSLVGFLLPVFQLAVLRVCCGEGPGSQWLGWPLSSRQTARGCKSVPCQGQIPRPQALTVDSYNPQGHLQQISTHTHLNCPPCFQFFFSGMPIKKNFF